METIEAFEEHIKNSLLSDKAVEYFMSLYELGKGRHVAITSNIDNGEHINSKYYDDARQELVSFGFIERAGDEKSRFTKGITHITWIPKRNYNGKQVSDTQPTNLEVEQVIETVKRMNDFQRMRVRQWL